MKKILLISLAMVILIAAEMNAKPRLDVSFNFFYSSLRPHGEWIQVDADVVAWRPFHIDSEWRPYTIGRWSWTNNGWYWDSDEPFGWATYHYGRWYLDDYYGWLWIPDYEWGPSWVEWRYNDDYIGWAPLPPYASFNINFGIHFSIGWHSNHNWWNFVHYDRFCHSGVHHYILDHRRNSRIFGHTKYRNNYYFDRDRIVNGGLNKEYVERRGGYRIAEREIRSMDNRNDFERSRERDNERIYSYRPSERETGKSNSEERFEIKRGDRNATIERDKLSVPKFSERADGKSSDRIISRDSERNSRNDESKGIIRGGRETERENPDKEREAIRNREENARRENERQEAIRTREENARNENERRNVIRERESQREQIERRAESERRVESERRTEQRREEPANIRSERSNERRSESRSESRNENESRGSSERRR